LSGLLDRVEGLLAKGGDVRIDGDDLVVSPLEAEQTPESTAELERLIDERLPYVELSELLIEVDGWTRFSDDFEHAGGTEPRSRELWGHLYAAILAQACNLGLTRMAWISDLTYQKLAWCTHWYVRDETLKTATTGLVNFQYHQPLSQFWGGGTLSSSDGQRFPVSGKVRMATALPRYFRYGKGVTFYTWTADQFSQYGTKVIPATVRDATYILDEILDNETELPLPGAHDRHGGLYRDRLRPVRSAWLAVLPTHPRLGGPAAVPRRPPEATPPPRATAERAS